ncbi:dienelactone hydrolase family protein [Bradyrhizobium sp.]|uniref:dienelactone hydrolase family protein n=1 Tax=Bradyrhizobium sp. TaxID=376 RepID=UPI0026180697|nr:dienelactone hydrolase family protein [Bradyrhizobium sp.]
MLPILLSWFGKSASGFVFAAFPTRLGVGLSASTLFRCSFEISGPLADTRSAPSAGSCRRSRRRGFVRDAGIKGWSRSRRHATLFAQTPQEVSMRNYISSVAGTVVAIVVTATASATIREVPVTYKDGEATMKGFVVYDDASQAKRPGIVMVHEWWGITKHIHDEARNFARQGYTVLISDMYGDAKTADNPKDAGALSSSVMKNPAVMEQRFNAARDELAKQPSVNPRRIGAVGYCFGGAVVINMARAGADLVAVAGFHASLGLNTPAPAPGTVKAKVLVMNGADDPFVKPEQYDALKKDFEAAKADYRVIEYPGAVHAFTNPEATELGKKFNLPLRYDAKADQESKAEAAKFFAADLKK